MVVLNNAVPRAINTPSFYWERQQGGLCRMHALNAYFGRAEYTPASFERKMAEFDDAQRIARGSDFISCKDFDATSADQQNLCAHILAKHGVFACFSPFGAISEIARGRMQSIGCAFVYNTDHIWLIREHEGQWYRIDSLSGISIMNLRELEDNRAVGVIIPIADLLCAYYWVVTDIISLIGPDIRAHLRREFARHRSLGDIETLIGSAITILRIQNVAQIGNSRVDRMIHEYARFALGYTRANCASLEFILNNVPALICDILRVCNDSVIPLLLERTKLCTK